MNDVNGRALDRAEARLRRLLAEVEEMTGEREPAFTAGYAVAGIRSALAEITAWRDPAPPVTRPAAPGAARRG